MFPPTMLRRPIPVKPTGPLLFWDPRATPAALTMSQHTAAGSQERPVCIAGLGVVSPSGLSGIDGSGALLLRGRAGAVPPISAEDDVAGPRQRRMMSRPAHFAAIAMRLALRAAGWQEPWEAVGCFMGTGASGGSPADLEALLLASIDEQGLSLPRLGSRGLYTINPLLTFQCLSNFTLCHGAILLGLGGPNGAFFSRGGGTVAALQEALWAVATGACPGALAGGADSALHPVTLAELRRDGALGAGLVPSEGAAVLALAPAEETAAPLAIIERCQLHPLRGTSLAPVLAALLPALSPFDAAVVAPWGTEARAVLAAALAGLAPAVRAYDLSAALGESLAATPALAWAAAADLMQAEPAPARVLVLTVGPDGELGEVLLRRPARPRQGGAACPQ